MTPEAMDREPRRLKLTAAAKIDYPLASEIRVGFADEWGLVHQLTRRETPLYVAAGTTERERATRDHFPGLGPEINLELTQYRLYKVFQPWPMPMLTVSWDDGSATGEVEQVGDLRIHLGELGQAQAWFGRNVGVLWECYLHEVGKTANWQDELAEIWRAVEKDMGVGKVLTLPNDPAFPAGYKAFLSRVGYSPDLDYFGWWSKRS